MRTIEITTSQNVAIEYELASVGERMVAFMIDSAIIWVSIGILSLFAFSILPNSMFEYVSYFIMVPIFFFYTLLSEIFLSGQSWGKKIMRIKVIKIDGTESMAIDYLIRWSFRMIDLFFSLGAVAILLITSTQKSQRLGDLVANTAIIKLKPKKLLRLKDIMAIRTRENYVLHYPAVSRMTEKEMIVVKNTLERIKVYPNQSHNEAVEELVDILCRRLNITEPVQDPVAFLKILINDYIVLTR